MKRILLFKIGAIGDVLMTTPFLRQFKKQKPDCVLDYIVGSKTKAILEDNPYLHDIIAFDESPFIKGNIFGLRRFFRKIRRMRHRYDAVVVFDKHRLFGFLFKLAGFKRRVGFDRAGKEGIFLTDKLFWNASTREVEYNLDLLKLFNLHPDYADQSYDMHVYEKDAGLNHMLKQLKSSGKKLIGISTGGGNIITDTAHGSNDCRRRNLNKWIDLVQKLLDIGYVMLLLGTPSDRHLPISDKNFHDLLGKYDLRQSVYLIDHLDMVICQESGFMHLVGCTRTPMIVMAGPTDPHRFYPYKHPGTILWKADKECYDMYGSYTHCTGHEIDRITVQDIIDIL